VRKQHSISRGGGHGHGDLRFLESGKYGVAIANAAGQALEGYGGTTFGIAASLEFIGAMAAALGLGQFLILLALGGMTLAAISLAVKCFQENGA
jgi:hypothetical protein